MPKSSRVLPLLALVAALLAAGCNESQKNQANAGCKAQYVGREKAACDLGVKLADGIANKADGKSYAQKYKKALKECNHLERPLVSFCVSGVKKYRTELAKLDGGRSRSPASEK